MNPGKWLTVSVVTNVALAAVAVVLYQTRPAPPAPQVVKQVVTNTSYRVVTKRPFDTNAFGLVTNIWRAVESADYATYIANLRTIGCPAETIRDIIITDINKLYAQKARGLNPALKNYQYWQADQPFDDPRSREFQRQLNQMEREKRDTVRALLGADYQAEMAKQSAIPNIQDRQLAFLSETKRSQLQAIQDKYNDLEQALYDQANGGELTAEQKARLKELQSQRRAEMGGLLSAAELNEYDLRTSSTAQDLRYRMGAFSGKEEDFRSVFQITKAYEDRLAQAEAAGTLTPELKAAAKADLERGLKDALGDRYAEYQRTQDASYRELYQAGQRNSLPPETVQKVYDMKRVAEEQRQLLLNSAELTEEQKAAGFAALQQETERAIKEALGEKAFRDYQRRGGEWMLNLGTPKDNKEPK